ncbi:MAG TPA: hypothetical protein VK133_03815 [Amoebophilaceae bacterium]|jgi:hypothetical protein|nr:hypothetical protein [Amoebophilaceae bacterium]
MKKKFLPWFLCFAHTTYALHGAPSNTVPVLENSIATEAVDTSLSDDPSQLPEEEVIDTYVPLIGNYPLFFIEALGSDWLHQANAVVLPVKQFDFPSLFHGNIALLYGIRLGKSRFALCPGVGYSNLEYAFAGKKAGGNTVHKTLKRERKDRTECQDIDTDAQLGAETTVTRSTCTIPYIDVLLRFRFNSVIDDPQGGFHFWLGAKFGIRMNVTTQIHYTEYDTSSGSLTRVGSFNMNPVAFGPQAGLGYQRFGLSGGYTFTSLFKEDQGPNGSNKVHPFGWCIYLNLL